jgi:hypothetical protein
MIYSYRFTHRLLDCDQVYSLIPCLFLAVSGPFATWATSGMETNLFTVCVLMGCYHSASYWRSYSRSDLYVSSVAFSSRH